MNWCKKTLGEIYEVEGGSIQTGPFGSQLHESDYKPQGIAVIMPKDIVEDKIDLSSIAFISKEDAKRLSQHIVFVDDIVFPRRGDINKRVLVDENTAGAFCGTGCIRLRGGDNSLLLPKFLFYYLKQQHIVSWIENQAIGATMMNLNTSILKSVPILLPSLQIQQKIASILSAYDELIENNKQRVKLLEEMAEAIYKEWFVRFRFPGYESTQFFDEKGKEVPHGTPGALPAGWTFTALKDCLKFYIGGGWGEDSPSTASQEPAYVIRGTDIPSAKVGNPNFQILRYHTKSNLSNRLLEENDIVFEVSGGTESQSLGRALLMSKELLERYDRSVICASFCKLIRTDTEVASPFYLYQLLERLYKTGEIMLFQVQSTGISNYKFEEFVSRQKVTVPSKSIQKRFEHFLKPVIQEIQLLGSKNQLLQQTRDLLLPRLISGKVSVEHLVEQELESLSLAAEPEPIYSK